MRTALSKSGNSIIDLLAAKAGKVTYTATIAIRIMSIFFIGIMINKIRRD